jgi:NAD+ synthase
MKKLEDKIKIAYFKYGAEYAAKELADQILEWTAGTGANGGVVGLSGGIDSTTVAYLCKYAFEGYNNANPDRKPLKLLGLIMPSKANNPKDAEDGLRVADLLGIERKVIPIQPLADAFIKQIPEALQKDYDIGNLYSEIRATVLSRYGAANNLRIMGTGNRDEDYVLGYFTKRGDGAVDNNILGNLPKRMVRELASFLGAPKYLVQRIPTAGLWPGQTDEGELGYNYDQAEIIQNGYDEGRTAEEIAKITGYDIRIVKDVDFRHRTTEHKRQPPLVGKATLEYK